jgi:hypothetical protein
VVRRNIRGRISQRTTLAHWLSSSGRSRCDSIHLAMYSPMTVSEVGRTTSGSSSSLPPAMVTTASSGEKPSTCSASRLRYDSGMNSGNTALSCPASLMRRSRSAWSSSQTR